MMLLLAALVTVSGVVVAADDVPLPGVTVTLTNRSASQTAVTDERGAYAFRGVAEDSYDLRYELAGFVAVDQRFTAEEGRSEVPAQRMELPALSDEIVLSCGRPCNDEPPVTPYDLPLCVDYELHATWIEAAEKGDRSAAALLRTRYAQALSRYERHRLGAALMGDDSQIWGELLAEAETCMHFPRREDELTPAYLEWAAAHAVPADEHWWASHSALGVIANDPRSHALLLQAVESEDLALAWTAVTGLAEQRDTASLPAIERALQRFPDVASPMAFSLCLMVSPAADEVAMKYLDETTREDYVHERERKAATLTR